MFWPVLNDIYLFSTEVALKENEEKNPRELNSPAVSKG